MEKYHYFENWIWYRLDSTNDLMVLFNLEFASWLKEVYFNRNGFFLDREIHFLNAKILNVKNELGISHFKKEYPYLNVKELQEYFDKSNSSILKAIEYGFDPYLVADVRSTCIYESLYKEDIKGKNEIIKIMSDYISIVNRIQYDQSQLTKKIC